MNELTFTQEKWWKNRWELNRESAPVASLVFKKWSWSVGTITIGGKEWEVGYTGWLGNRLFLKDQAGTTLFEVVPERWWKSEITIPLHGRLYELKEHWWKGGSSAADEASMEIMSLSPSWWSGSAKFSTTLSPKETDTLLLACVLFFRYKVTEMNSSIGATTAGSVAAVSSS